MLARGRLRRTAPLAGRTAHRQTGEGRTDVGDDQTGLSRHLRALTRGGPTITIEDHDVDRGLRRQPAATRRVNPALTFVRELVFVVVGALVVSSLLRAFVGQMFIIPSESMENTLLKGDRVIVEKLTDFHRGDVVVFQDPAGWLDEPTGDSGPVDRVLEFVGFPTESSPKHLIKRVIGMPGDTVVCCDESGRVTVNGTALDETNYLYTRPDGEQVVPSDMRFRVVVPTGRIFVMGDHRDDSADSRCHLADLSAQGQGQTAFVPITDVVGPAVAIASPLDRTRRLRTPSTFSNVPAPAAPAPSRAQIEPAGATCS